MTVRQKSYENTLRDRGLPQDIANLITKYVPFENFRNEFKDLVITLYGEWVPQHFLKSDYKFDEMIQALWDLMGTASLRDYIKRNFWRMFYTRNNPLIPNEIEELDNGTKVNIRDLIDNSVMYELSGSLYDAFFNPDPNKTSYSWSRSEYLPKDYSIFFLGLIWEMMSNENIELTFNDFFENNDVDLNLGTEMGSWSDDPKRLTNVKRTLEFTGIRSEIYKQLQEYHQKFLDSS